MNESALKSPTTTLTFITGGGSLTFGMFVMFSMTSLAKSGEVWTVSKLITRPPACSISRV